MVDYTMIIYEWKEMSSFNGCTWRTQCNWRKVKTDKEYYDMITEKSPEYGE